MCLFDHSFARLIFGDGKLCRSFKLVCGVAGEVAFLGVRGVGRAGRGEIIQELRQNLVD